MNMHIIMKCIWTSIFLCSFISQVEGISSMTNRRDAQKVISSNQQPGRPIFSNRGKPAGVQTPHQPQRTTVPSFAQCGRSPASYGRRNTVQTIKPGDFPWLAALVVIRNPQIVNGRVIRKREFVVMCGGTLITDRHVLSAAHCFPRSGVQPNHVRLGEHDIREDEDSSQDFLIVDKRAHNFNQVTNANDIILLKLDRRVKFNSHVFPACLPFGLPEEYYFRKHLTVVGWGKTTKSDIKSYTPMREEPVHVPIRECQQYYQRYSTNPNNAITSNNICAGLGAADSCMGDSGGPLNYQSSNGRVFVVGIVSFGSTKCGSPNLPGVYTNVAKYQNWITKNLN